LNCWVRGNAVKANQIDFPEMKSYASIDELLADEVDLVIVNTPSRRITNTLKVLGKHAVVEKHLRQRWNKLRNWQLLPKKNETVCFSKPSLGQISKPYKKIISDEVLGDIVEAEFHFDRYNPLLSPKQHKETLFRCRNSKDLGPHLIDQALFGLPQSVLLISELRAQSLVDDCIDILLYYASFRVRIKQVCAQKPIQPMSFTEKRFVLKLVAMFRRTN
jgi:predicted dehydrogenase